MTINLSSVLRGRVARRLVLLMVSALLVSTAPLSAGLSSASAVRSAVVSVAVAPAVVSAGVPVRVSGVLRFVGGGSGAGRIVSVFVRRPVAGAAWSHVGSVRTDARGSYNFRLVRQTSAQVQVRFAGGPGLPAGLSSVRSLLVRGVVGSVSLKGIKSPGVVVGDRLSFTARASAGLAGGRASIQVLRGSWREVAAGKVRAGGVVGVVFAPAVGAQRYRLVVAGSADLTAAATGAVVVRTYSRTKISYFTPFRSDGWPSLPVASDPFDLRTCQQSLFSPFPNVTACQKSYSYRYYIACWQRSPTSTSVLCMDRPDDTVLYGSGGRMPATRPRSGPIPPWTMTLADGSVCDRFLRSGGLPVPEGYGYSSQCFGATSAVLVRSDSDETDRSRATWSVYSTRNLDDPNSPVVRQFVTSVVFAGPRPSIPAAKTSGCPTKAQLAPHLPRGYAWANGTDFACVGGWTVVAANVVGDDTSDAIVFRPVGRSWQGYNRNVFCPGPSAMPADLWSRACNVD